MQLGDVFMQLDPITRQLLMMQQMQDAQNISDAVPRSLPELPVGFRPPERWNYPTPVRLG